MSSSQLQQALASVPFFGTLGLKVTESRPGAVVLTLPATPGNTNHAGCLHSGALFGVGEAAAGIALGTHPALAHLTHLQRASGIRYLKPPTSEVKASAEVTGAIVDSIQQSLNRGEPSKIELVVDLCDAQGQSVAEVVSVFSFRA